MPLHDIKNLTIPPMLVLALHIFIDAATNIKYFLATANNNSFSAVSIQNLASNFFYQQTQKVEGLKLFLLHETGIKKTN